VAGSTRSSNEASDQKKAVILQTLLRDREVEIAAPVSTVKKSLAMMP
jgi:hypothetical protein